MEFCCPVMINEVIMWYMKHCMPVNERIMIEERMRWK